MQCFRAPLSSREGDVYNLGVSPWSGKMKSINEPCRFFPRLFGSCERAGENQCGSLLGEAATQIPMPWTLTRKSF